MNKIYKVIYSKVKQCYIVVSELAKSHVKSSHGSNGQQKAALTMSVLLALGAFTFAFGPTNAEAETKTKTDGFHFIGVERTDGTFEDSSYKNYNGGGAEGPQSITIGTAAEAGNSTITIGDRRAGASIGSVYVGQGDIKNPFTDRGGWVTSVGYNSDATGYGSIAIGSNAIAKNDIKQNIELSNASGDLNDNPTIKGASVALGYSASAADGALAMGSNASATNLGTALGYDASAADGNIAIGANSVATAAASTDNAKFRDTTASDYNAPSSYVSVGSSSNLRRITNVAAGADANDAATVGQLEKVAAQKGSWQLTVGGTNASTVDGDHNTVDFSAGSDGNLSVSKTADTNNVTIGLKKDVTLGKATSGNGGSLSVYAAPGEGGQYGSHIDLDGNTVSVRYTESGQTSEKRGVVLGVAEDADHDKYGYISFDNGEFYLHGATKEDGNNKVGRLVYTGDGLKEYIANLNDGIKFSGDTKDSNGNVVTVDTKLDSSAGNNTLNITGGADSSNLSNGNIGVVATANTTDSNGDITKAGGLKIQLAKDLKGITSVANGADGSGATITLGTSGTTISGGDVDVSNNKITGLKDGTVATDAATVGQMNTAIGNAKTKYYSVNETYDGNKISGDEAKTIFGDYAKYLNEGNDGATGFAGMASGYMTQTSGIASTVGGSFSGVLNATTTSGKDFRGAAALSYGTFNINDNTSKSQPFSGVANSIVGQANMTTDSNAAIIVGAGNSVTNSYRPIDATNAGAILQNLKDPTKLNDALKAAVPNSGAQVMVMGGGNKITSAYMTQVIGVGNTITGQDTTYAAGTSTQYNYVDGSNNTLTNGKGDYIIGANNSVTGDSIDKNQSNIVVGDNHTLTNQKNNVVLGSADSKAGSRKELAASDAVVIGHNADVQKDGGVAIGSESVASIDAGATGYDPETGSASTAKTGTWKATNAAVSVGKADGSLTRQITGVAAGTADTDAVNVAQIKKLGSKIGLTDTLSVKYDKTGGSGSAGGSITDYSRITLQGQQGGTTILNLADGTREDAAVNFGQLRQKADLDAGNIGSHYTPDMKDENGDVIYYSDQWDKDSPYYVDKNDSKYGTPVKETDTSKIEAAQRENENSWGTAIGTGKIADAKASDASSNGSQQLVTGGTVYSEVRPTDYGEEKNKTTYHYISPSNTTGANLAALDEGLAGVDSSSVKYDTKTVDGQSTVDKTKITLGDGTNDTTVTHVKSALADAKDSSGKAATIATATGDALKNAVNLGDLQTAYTALDSKAGAHTALTVEGGTQANGEKDKDSKNLYAGKNIQLHSDTDATTGKVTYDVKLAKDLTGISSISNQTTTGDKTTGAKIELGTNGITISGGDVDVDGNKVTNLKDGDLSDKSTDAVTGKQLYQEQQDRIKAIGTLSKDKYNYIDKTASVSDNLDKLDTQVKTNADNISSITKKFTDLDGNAVKYDNATKSKITLAGNDGTTIDKVKDGTISATSKEAINGSQLNTEQEARKAADTAINNKIGSLDKDGNYIKKDASISTNLNTLDGQVKTNADAISKETQDREAADKAINDKIGSLDKDGNYIKKDDSISKNLSTLDGQVKTNATNIADNTKSINEIRTTVNDLSDNAVQYDKDSKKGKITLAGQDGTTITNVKDGSVAKDSKDAVNGGQLYDEKDAREKADTEIKNDITKIKDGEGFTDKGKTVIKSLAQDAVDVKGSDNVTVTNETKDGTKTFTVKVDGNGKVASGDKGLISGDTIYNELRPTADGSYIKKDSTTAQNLTNLDTQVKKTSDLINSDGKTIKIGGSDAATKVDVSGKDSSGNSTSRVITGVKTDANDSTSAASVGYVNDMNAANTQQIYHDMNSAYSHVENDISKAAAGSNALAALHPMEFDPDDKAQYALGYGHYRNANAGAVGVFYQPDENSMFSIGASFGNGDAGINAGVTVKFGPGGSDHHALTKTQMAKVINEQSKEIDTLKKENADKDKRIDALEQKVNEILAKVEKDKA